MNRASKDRIQEWIEGMAQFNATPEFGTTRILFTKPELENRKYVREEMMNLGLDVHEDAIGNIYAVRKGTDSSLPPVWTGSHIDTVPNAGNYDGMAGVVCGLEAVRLFNEVGAVHKRDICVIVYTSEEPTRFGLSCLGSRAMSGDMSLEHTRKIKDNSGRSLYDKLTELGYDVDLDYDDIRRDKGDVYASVELHIEQNRNLEQAGKTIGVVRKICAPSIYNAEITGVQSHAGGTDMGARRDAFAALSEMELALEKMAQECESEYNTATIGHVEVIPNAVNVIPGKVRFSVDIRDCNWDSKQKLIHQMQTEFEQIASRRNVILNMEEENNDMPLSCDDAICSLIENSCEKFDLENMDMISGPYHDSLFVGKFAPTAMIFVPSHNGISHSPDEYTSYEDLASGADVLADVLLKLANE